LIPDEIVGYAAGFRIDEKTAMAPHTWTQITGGYAAGHDPVADVEVFEIEGRGHGRVRPFAP
jgi:hypothetical protein